MSCYDDYLRRVRSQSAKAATVARSLCQKADDELSCLTANPLVSSMCAERIGSLKDILSRASPLLGGDVPDEAKRLAGHAAFIESALEGIDAKINSAVFATYSHMLREGSVPYALIGELEGLFLAWQRRSCEAEGLMQRFESVSAKLEAAERLCASLTASYEAGRPSFEQLPTREDFSGMNYIDLIATHNALTGILSSAMQMRHREENVPPCCARAALYRLSNIPPPSPMSMRVHNKVMVRRIVRREGGLVKALRSGHWDAPRDIALFDSALRAFRGVCMEMSRHKESNTISILANAYALMVWSACNKNIIKSINPEDELDLGYARGEVSGEVRRETESLKEKLFRYMLLDLFSGRFYAGGIDIFSEDIETVLDSKANVKALADFNTQDHPDLYTRAMLRDALIMADLNPEIANIAMPMNFIFETRIVCDASGNPMAPSLGELGRLRIVK